MVRKKIYRASKERSNIDVRKSYFLYLLSIFCYKSSTINMFTTFLFTLEEIKMCLKKTDNKSGKLHGIMSSNPPWPAEAIHMHTASDASILLFWPPPLLLQLSPLVWLTGLAVRADNQVEVHRSALIIGLLNGLSLLLIGERKGRGLLAKGLPQLSEMRQHHHFTDHRGQHHFRKRGR